MKAFLLLAPLSLMAVPAIAQPAPADAGEIQRLINDPRMADQMTSIARAISKAVLDMPVGEIQAAAEGRAPTAADKRRTVRTESGMTEQELDRQITRAEPAIRNGMKAMSAAIPSMMQAMTGMAEAIERAAGNMPDPTYPRR